MINSNIEKLNRITNFEKRNGFLRLDMNENPEGLPQKFVDETLKEITPEFLATYPNYYDFKLCYAKYLSVPFDCVQPTNGSDMAIRMLFDIYVTEKSNVVGVSPSFEMYRINAEMKGATYIGIRYNPDLTLDHTKILNSIDENTSVVVLLNPNNPIGNSYTRQEIMAIIEKARKYRALVIIDEAYHYFSKISYVDLINRFDNIAILRTFSKLFSIAALRLGVIIASKSIIDNIFKTQPSFDINSVALLFGKKLLNNKELVNSLVDNFKQSKQYVTKWFNEHNYETVIGDGNYILFSPRSDIQELINEFKANHILVKSYTDPLLSRYIRINIGSIEKMSEFFNLLENLDSNDNCLKMNKTP